jgi:L-ascorbate metabolism protein UlaG (beta-lactamase superfamily)
MVKIQHLGHSSFKISNDDFSIVLDPYENGSVNGLLFPKNVEANLVLCSHEHRDHNAREYIKLISSAKSFQYQEYLLPHDHQKGNQRGLVYGRIFSFDNISFAHLGDVGDISPLNLFDPFKGVDVLFVPINGFYTISAKETKILADYIKPKLVIPMHYQIKNPPSGYPDNWQIEIFKSLFPNFLKVSSTISLNPDIYSYQALIFNK